MSAAECNAAPILPVLFWILLVLGIRDERRDRKHVRKESICRGTRKSFSMAVNMNDIRFENASSTFADT